MNGALPAGFVVAAAIALYLTGVDQRMIACRRWVANGVLAAVAVLGMLFLALLAVALVVTHL